MKILAIIPTRNGDPPLSIGQGMHAACVTASRVLGIEVGWQTTTAHLSVEVARNMAVALAYKENATHLFMADDDTMIPPDAIVRLFNCHADVATGVTPTTLRCMATYDEIPVINVADSANDIGQAQFYREWFHGQRPVKYCGASCILIDMRVFDKVGFPWFQMGQTWDAEHKKYWNQSEDLHFCERVRRAGLTIIADGDCRCDHKRTVRCKPFITEEVEAELQPA